MNELKVIEYRNIRVLTTQQIAEAYEANPETVTKNFNRNKDRYAEGKHFICLKGDELKDFRANGQIDLLPNLNTLYLWTEKGAFLHAKSLNTDKAWEVYDQLVDNYFTKKPLTQLEILQQSVAILNRHDKELKQIDNRMDKLEYDIPLYGAEADELSSHVKRKGVKVLGSKQSEAYKDSEIRSKVYRDIYDQIRREFNLYDNSGKARSYKSLKRKYIADAHELIDCYVVPTYLAELIEAANAQMNLGVA
ncbi:ORF6N domain-containing protein,ORF6C domain-containing protein [Clostridium sp. ASBs410]|nr:ORF6N domain-containing protein,ORF6C domain-containing protein [Clostridium sp. ASBs410]